MKKLICVIILLIILSGCRNEKQVTIIGIVDKVEIQTTTFGVEHLVYLENIPYRLFDEKEFYKLKIGWCAIIKDKVEYNPLVYFTVDSIYAPPCERNTK